MFQGVSWCIPTWVYFTLVHSTPSITLPYPFPSIPLFQQLSIHILISSTFTGVMIGLKLFTYCRTLPFSQFWPLTIIFLFSSYKWLTTVGVPCKWNHAGFIFLRLAYFI
jgi:hypothetical protein